MTNAKMFTKPIVTKIEPLKDFYPAKNYHQDYLIQNPTYIVYNYLPKIEALKQIYPRFYRETPVTLASISQ